MYIDSSFQEFYSKGKQKKCDGNYEEDFFFKMRKVTHNCNKNQVERKITNARKKKD